MSRIVAMSCLALLVASCGVGTDTLTITNIDSPESMVSGGEREDMLIYWSGDATFPVIAFFRPREGGCPAGTSCSSPTMTFETEENPLVFPDAVYCYGLSEPVVFGYEVVLRDSDGIESEPYPVDLECVIP